VPGDRKKKHVEGLVATHFKRNRLSQKKGRSRRKGIYVRRGNIPGRSERRGEKTKGKGNSRHTLTSSPQEGRGEKTGSVGGFLKPKVHLFWDLTKTHREKKSLGTS